MHPGLNTENGIVVDKITIPISEYNRLLKAARTLEALEMGGVDNWPGYSDALIEYERLERESIEKIVG